MARLNLLRIPYLIGMLVDAVAAGALMTPAGSPLRALAYPGVLPSETAFADGTRTAFALMVGWTVLLGWAARRPIERRIVLLFTAFPVVTGLVLTELIDVAGGHATWPGTSMTIALQIALCAVCLGGYATVRRSAIGDGGS